jgi:NAD(P) transhydrogenase
MVISADTHQIIPQSKKYDLIVIGSGPGGHRAAVQAAKLGQRVLIIERDRIGGSCLHLGTIPSKALREAVLSAGSAMLTLSEVMARTHRVIEEESTVIGEHFHRNRIEYIQGTGSFVDAHQIKIENLAGSHLVTARAILIATGTRPRRPKELDFGSNVLFDSDTIVGLKGQPKTLLVVGAGVIGCEYASIFARMGVKVTLTDSRAELLSSIDREIVAALLKQFEASGVEVLLSTDFLGLTKITEANHSLARVNLTVHSAPQVRDFDAVLYCLGRTGNFESLNLASLGVDVDARGLIAVNRNYQTSVPHVYAVGDVIGAPALAASSSEQGRLAILHAFTGANAEFPDTFPYGIYTIPEISSVGVQEKQLAERGIRYVVGKAPFPILARGKMLNDEFGFLKLIVHRGTRRIVGVHVIGTSATELVHIGQVAMAFGATVDFFVDNVFNYPTLAEAYKIAAFNAENKLR